MNPAFERAAIPVYAQGPTPHATLQFPLQKKYSRHNPLPLRVHSLNGGSIMFEQALLESARHSPGARRACSTAVSLLTQSLILAAFIIVPLLATQGVPHLQQRWFVVLPNVVTPAPRVEPTSTDSGGGAIVVAARQLVQPSHITRLDRNATDTSEDPAVLHPNIGTSGHQLAAIGTGAGPALPDNPATRYKPPVSVLEAGVVLTRVQPLYPHIAVINRIQGTVHLNAVITSSGTLEELRVLSGQPVLAQAAADAVRQWKFRPYMLNGKPIEVQTEVIVKFSLD